MSSNDEIEMRRALLDFFSSELTSHGTYAVSVIISIFAFLEITTRLEKTPFFVTFLIFGVLMTGALYLFVRILFWSRAATNILYCVPSDLGKNLFHGYYLSAVEPPKIPQKKWTLLAFKCFILKYCSKPELTSISFLATCGFSLSLGFLYAFGIYPAFPLLLFALFSIFIWFLIFVVELSQKKEKEALAEHS